MARKKSKGTELSVFKGREAKLNRAIFQTLAIKGPRTIYDIHKEITGIKGLRHARYASVNKRIKILEKCGYVYRASIKETKAGFEAYVYELHAKAYLAMVLQSISLEELVMKVNDQSAQSVLAGILYTLES